MKLEDLRSYGMCTGHGTTSLFEPDWAWALYLGKGGIPRMGRTKLSHLLIAAALTGIVSMYRHIRRIPAR